MTWLQQIDDKSFEIHSTDLTDGCPRRVQLRWEGKLLPHAPTALVRGMLAGSSCEHLHKQYLHTDDCHVWPDEQIEDLAKKSVSVGWDETERSLIEDGRIITDSVERNIETIKAEVQKVLVSYIKNLGPLFLQTTLLGCETPCRMVLESDGEVYTFASHTDLIVRDPENAFGFGKGRVLIMDWKWRMEAPTKAYLSRNLQFAMYWLMGIQGKFKLQDWSGFTSIPDCENPQMVWLHLPYLKPYNRKTIAKDKEGREVVYKKGDTRPISSTLRAVNFLPENMERVAKTLVNRVDMYKAGFFPAIPEPVRCANCEAESFWTRFDTAPIHGDNNE